MVGTVQDPDRPALEALIAADVRALTAQSDQIGHDFAGRHAMTANDFRALLHITVAETTGEPLAAGELRTRMGMSGAAITYLVERMITSGHLLREPDPADRRKVKLRVAEHGMQVAREFFTAGRTPPRGAGGASRRRSAGRAPGVRRRRRRDGGVSRRSRGRSGRWFWQAGGSMSETGEGETTAAEPTSVLLLSGGERTRSSRRRSSGWVRG